MMSTWLKVISWLNPLTHVVNAPRISMLAGSPSSFCMGVDYTVIPVTTVILVLICARLYLQLGVSSQFWVGLCGPAEIMKHRKRQGR